MQTMTNIINLPLEPDMGTPEGIAQSALRNLKHDPGSIFEPDVLAAIAHVRQSNPAEWQRIRAAAKSEKVQLAELECLTMPQACNDSEQGDDEAMFRTVHPNQDVQDGRSVISSIRTSLRTHVIASEATIEAAAYWCLHTWMMDDFTVSPIARITAPDKSCGKTTLMAVMAKMVSRPLHTSNTTPAALFRAVDMWSPCLLIDEADTFMRGNDELRGLINCGLYRESAHVIRVQGDDHMPTKFKVWAPKIIAGIGSLHGTIESRSIPLRMGRKETGEKVLNIRHTDQADWDFLASRIARWIEDNREAISKVKPRIVDGLNDRQNDCMEPLLQIAEVIGESYAERLAACAVELYAADDEKSEAIELLENIRDVFRSGPFTQMHMSRLLEHLTANPEWMWQRYDRGQPMSPRRLGRMLKEFGIQSVQIRSEAGGQNGKGYRADMFKDAFRRYLPD